VDHPPVTVWYPFGLQHAPAEKMAAATAPISGVTSRPRRSWWSGSAGS